MFQRKMLTTELSFQHRTNSSIIFVILTTLPNASNIMKDNNTNFGTDLTILGLIGLGLFVIAGFVAATIVLS